MCYIYKGYVKIPPLGMIDDLMAIAKCGVDSIYISAFINTQIELKNMKFHTIDKKGKSKCHWMHIGMVKCKMNCSAPKVHGHSMIEVEEDTYLGEIIQRDGKNTSNIRSRINRGIGNISQIINILKCVTFGQFKIQTGLLMRRSIFISSLLFQCEAWYDFEEREKKTRKSGQDVNQEDNKNTNDNSKNIAVS